MFAMPPSIAFPALLWRRGYVFVAQGAVELFVHPRSLFSDTVARAQRREWHLAESSGRCSDICDWFPIAPIGGLKGFGLRIMGSVFAAPVLVNEARPSLPEFKQKLAKAIRTRYQHSLGRTPAAKAIEAVESAGSFEAAIRALPRNWDDCE